MEEHCGVFQFLVLEKKASTEVPQNHFRVVFPQS